MTEEELQEEQRRDFEARRDLAFKQLVCALNEGDAEIFDIEVENEEAVNVLDGCRTYLRHNLKIENIDLNVEEREPF